MKRIATKSTSLNGSDYVTFNLPSYSKILNFQKEYDQLYIMFEYPMEINDEEKITHITLYRGIYSPTIVLPNESIYHSTIKNVENTISSGQNGSRNINLNIELYNEYFHIFVQEIKGLSELRDEKLNELV